MEVSLVCEDGYLEDVVATLESMELEILHEFESEMVLIEISESDLDQVSDLAGVEAISPNEAMDVKQQASAVASGSKNS
jgi:hypothetical protein